MKERIKNISCWIEDRLRYLCGEITPDKRLTVVLIILLLFTILNLYLTFSAISNFGKEKAKKEFLKIESAQEPDDNHLNQESNE